MIDIAQNLVIGSDLSVLSSSVFDLVNIHFNLVDIHSHVTMDLLAQQFQQDVLGDIMKGWNSFVKSGQIWALIIGVVVGYLFRSITNA